LAVVGYKEMAVFKTAILPDEPENQQHQKSIDLQPSKQHEDA
jgi:hypothetical protein